jgi:lipopolysaccharide export system permease protein
VIILDRYIMSHFVKGLLPVLLLLLALFSFLTLADELEEVGKGTFTLVDAFQVVLYTLPRLIVDLLPVTALLGGLMGLGVMANHQELIVARAAGMSRARMALPVFLVSLSLAVLVALMQSLLIPVSEREASQLRSRSLEETSMDAAGRLEFWTRSHGNIVHVNDVLFNSILSKVEIYSTDQQGKLRQLIQAEQATISGVDTWLLNKVVRTDLSGMETVDSHLSQLEWPGLLSREQANILMLPLESLAPYNLIRYIAHMEENDLATHHLRVIFWSQMSSMIAVIAMGLLALPMLAGSTRSISASQRIMLGGIIGIAFYLLQQLSGHMANLFKLLPSVTIMTPVVLLLVIAVVIQFWHGPRSRKRKMASALSETRLR